MQYRHLIIEMKGPALYLTIARPEKLNALSVRVLEDLERFVNAVIHSPPSDIRGMVVMGAGSKAFVAGADIKEQAAMNPAEGADFGKLGQRVMGLFEQLPFPAIACVDGYALGGGCELALACDFIYATQAARFGQPEVGLGLIPGFGGCVRLSRYIGLSRAKELIYTGKVITGEEAQRIGLVHSIFSTRREMLRGADDTIRRIAMNSPVAVKICKDMLHRMVGQPVEKCFEIENHGFLAAYSSQDKRIGVSAFLEKREAVFTGK